MKSEEIQVKYRILSFKVCAIVASGSETLTVWHRQVL